ncbi:MULTISPECIES: multidrug effflux MFS transporter [unclassified Microbacterium]|uniref:multidrug effflux MFS transporter n=1 Tax=unclassified Microbacterium TaxID=2609290 RepID=UPI000EA8B81A|nr:MULTISPECIES: multidrug effflux MFS transporter [unclassified Microbacterium]MBT2484402.1 multidrug effflux MFS transporter [Microbacterium sp. ISL-108]RKN67313.1 Bcr/CflA family efflux MFS transporter [Microbacterium sp. CGR2]
MPGSEKVSAPSALFFIVLGFVQALWPLTMDLYLPAFPAIATSLDATPGLVSFTLTGAFLGMAAGQLTAGPLSDRIGRMRPLVAALGLYVVSSVICAAAPSIEVLIGARVVQGVGASAGAVITLAIVRDCAAGARMVRLLARLQLINGTFVVTSPALGALLLQITDWRGLFWTLVGFGAALGVAIVFTVAPHETHAPESRSSGSIRALTADYRAMVTDASYRFPLAANTLLWAGMMGYMASSSFLFQDVYGLGPTAYALVFGGHGAVMIVGAQVSARLSGRWGLQKVIALGAAGAAGSVVVLVTGVLVAPPGSLAAFVGPLFCFTASFGVLSPCLQASALQNHGARAGTAASVLGSSTMIAGALAAPLVASFGVSTVYPTAVFLAVCALGAGGVILWSRVQRRSPV